MTERIITEPGIYDMPDAVYQADPCVEISLRSSIAWKLIQPGSVPAHVAYGCDRLNPNYVQPEEKRFFDIGKAAHSLLLGKGADFAIVHAENYKKGDARKLRETIQGVGKVALLEAEAAQVRTMAKEAHRQIAGLIEAGTVTCSPFEAVSAEKVIVWRDHGVLCRAMLDGLSIDSDIVSEYKTEGQSAAPELWQWKARKLGYLFRLAFYRRGLEALKLAYSPQIHIFVQETFPPYLLAFYRIEDELIAKEDERVKRALRIWRRCVERNEWPGYARDGFDLGLTYKEKEQEAMAKDTKHLYLDQHVDSETIARDL